MKVAFTTSGGDLSAPLDPRFGRAAKFLIYDLDTDSFAVVANPAAESPHGAGIKAAETIVKAGAGALVTGDCGPKAMQVLAGAGVAVYACDAATVGEALERFRAGDLAKISA